MIVLAATPDWSGTIPTWLLVLITLAVMWRVTRGGGGSAVSELSKANEILDKKNHDLGAEVRDLRIENEGLKARTDFAVALAEGLKPVIDWTALHEQRALERHEASVHALEAIRDRMLAIDGANSD